MTLNGKKLQVVVIVFIFSLLLRAGIVVCLEPDRPIESDGKYYFETAVNLANGYGYTWDGKNPFFFREPGVIYFYAGCIKVFKYFYKIDILERSNSTCKLYMWKYKNQESSKVIRFIRIIQALLQSLTILLFFLIINKFVNYKIALITFGFLSIFPPYFFHVFSILREILLAFLLMVFAYLFAIYLKKHKIWMMFLLGIIWGLIALTFQVYIILGGLAIIYFLAQNCNSIFIIFKPVLFLIFGFILTVMPWIVKVYSYYPDLRIIKTLGVSMTHEQNNFITALSQCDNPKVREKYCCNFFQDECEMDYRHIIWYQQTSQIHFLKSFNGTYAKDARELKESTSNKRRIEFFISDLKIKLKQSFFRFGTENLVVTYFGGYKWWKISYYLIGLLSLFGFLIHFKKSFDYSFIYVFHIGLFYLIGSESRRMLPIQPYIVYFFIVSNCMREMYNLFIKARLL